MWPSSDEHVLEIINKTPSKRIAEPSEIARLVSFILDSESGYINGANYAIDWWLTAI
jgi:3-oxoacyl-[acyl-carrier protein] reductase